MRPYDTGRLSRKSPYDEVGPCSVRRSIFPKGSIWVWICTISLLCVLFVVGSLSISLMRSVGVVREEATSVKTYAKQFLSAAKEGDKAKLEKSAQKVSDSAHKIQDEMNTSLWEFASRIPIVGTDVDDVRILSEVLTDFSDNAMIPMAKSGKILALSEFVHDSSINAAVLPSLLYAVEEASPSLERGAEAFKNMPPAHIGPIKSIIDGAKDSIISANTAVKRMRPIFPYLSGLLGADGQPKRYLILAENTAEIHASGGFVGSFAVMTVTNGKIDIGKFSNLKDVLSFGDNPAGATKEEIETFGDACDTSHGDHNLIPDFTRVGQLYHNIWSFYQDLEVDGVFGLDPVFLQYLLGVVGEVKTSYGVTVNGNNAAAIMLNQSLFWWPPKKCDEFYREVADKTLSRIFGDLDGMDVSAFLTAVSRAADEGRCLVWVKDPIIEESLKEAGFAGNLLHDPTSPQLGIYISDRSASKESFYLSMDADVSNPSTNEDGSSSYKVSVTIKNNFEPKTYDKIPKYIEVMTKGRDNLDLTEQFHLVAPEGGRIENVDLQRVNTQGNPPDDSDWKQTQYQGFDVHTIMLRMEPQESVVVSFTLVTSPEVVNPLTIRKTPLMPPEYAYWNEKMPAPAS